MNVLIVGCGAVGTRLGARLAERGARVFGLRREPSGLEAHGIEPVAGDVTDADGLRRAVRSLPKLTVVCNTVAAGRGGDYRAIYVGGARHLLDALADRPPERLIHASSTGVYGQTDGSWVDETSPTDPVGASGRVLLETERLLLGSGIPTVVLRLAGLYGPGRSAQSSFRDGRARIYGPDAWTNRIHLDDAANAMAHLTDHGEPGELFCGSDGDPLTRAEVARRNASRFGVPLPPVATADEWAALSPATRDRLTGNRRVSNRKLLETGFRLEHPTFSPD